MHHQGAPKELGGFTPDASRTYLRSERRSAARGYFNQSAAKR